MYDEEEERWRFIIYVVTTSILFGVNVIAYFYSDHLVSKISGYSMNGLNLDTATEAVGTILINAWVVLFTETISWIAPKLNFFKVYNELELEVNRKICLVIVILFNCFVIFSLLSTIHRVYMLLMASGMSLFDYIINFFSIK